MQTARLRLYTKNISYLRMLQGAFGKIDSDAVAQTESMIANYTKAQHAVLTSMGRMAMYEGLRALDVKSGEIILSPVTVPEVISLVILAGFTPVFCDVKPGIWNIDTSKVESLITEKTVAIMTTHFWGDMNTAYEVRALCDKHKLIMIEDAAQAVGAWKNGKHAGTIGDFGILSFSYPKNVTSFYGGCLITNNDTIAKRVRDSISQYPPVDAAWINKKVKSCMIMDLGTFRPFFQLSAMIIRYGYKHNIRWIINIVMQHLNDERLSEVPKRYLAKISPQQAKAIADKWPEIDEDVEHRIACAAIYHRHLSPIKSIISPPFADDHSNTYLYFPIQVEDKLKLQRYMVDNLCDVAIQHSANCADLEAYKEFYRDCPHARATYAGTVMLPVYRGFPLEHAERYAKTIKRFFAQ